MKKFIFQLVEFAIIPVTLFLILLITYLYYDPFQVLYKYKTFYISGEPRYVTLNYDYVAVEAFLNNYPNYKYDSFIIGDSHSRFFEMDIWSKYINSDKCFHFDASYESLYGICKKIKFLHEKNVDISNVLIVLDYYTLINTTNSEFHLNIKHPLLSGQENIVFQFEFFKAYCSLNFLWAYFDFKISGQVKKYMKTKLLLNDTPMEYNLKYNEMRLKSIEDSINVNPSKYYSEKRTPPFYERDTLQKYSPEVIGIEQMDMLNYIRKVFKEHATNFKIVISPLYDQLKLNRKDLDILMAIFGSNNVYDFSGINSFTSDYHNYYEASHYRPQVARKIMSIIYKDDQIHSGN